MGAAVVRGAALFALFLLSGAAIAQDATKPSTRTEQIQLQREQTFRTPVEPDTDIVERAVVWAYDRGIINVLTHGWHGLAPTAGGMIDYSGIPFGVQFMRADLLNGEMIFRTSARLSTRAYQLFDMEAGMPELAGGHAFLDLYLRHRNYPQVDYYGPGARSNIQGRSNYRLEDSQADISTGLRPVKWLRIGAAGGYYRPNVGPGTAAGIASSERLYSPAVAPGIRRQTDFLHGGPMLHVDYRDSPYGPRSGGQYYGRLDYFRDRAGAGFTFRRVTGEAQQFVPLFNKKRVIALRAKSVLSLENPAQQVPFYLQPSIGGSDDLRGFRPFRFYGPNSVVYNAEWRWEVMSNVDAALFYDTGKVFTRPGLLNFRHMEKSYGGGLRFRAPVTGAVIARLDVAVSREGVQFDFSFWDLFATPQVRTGRELSPPVGRLP